LKSAFSESTVEQAALALLESAGWGVAQGPGIAPDTPAAERADYSEGVLVQRLRDGFARLDPELPEASKCATAEKRALLSDVWATA
jgi:type I restriction enzyme R subunit